MTTHNRARNSLLAITTQRSDDLLLFVFAFDGVLAAYQSDRRRVRLAPDRRAQLQRLQRISRVVVGVVSGRPLNELRRLVKLGDAAFYIGLNGLEVVGRHFERIRNEIAGDYRRPLLEASDAVGRTIGGVAGARLELKGAVLALHTREATSEDAIWSRFQLLSASSDLVTSGVARVVRRHDVLELVPNVGHAKAHALVAIRRILEPVSQIRLHGVHWG